MLLASAIGIVSAVVATFTSVSLTTVLISVDALDRSPRAMDGLREFRLEDSWTYCLDQSQSLKAIESNSSGDNAMNIIHFTLRKYFRQNSHCDQCASASS